MRTSPNTHTPIIHELRALLPRGGTVYGVETQHGERAGWYSVMLLVEHRGTWRNISPLVYDALAPWLHITRDGRRVAAIAWGSLGWAVVREVAVLLHGEQTALEYHPLHVHVG